MKKFTTVLIKLLSLYYLVKTIGSLSNIVYYLPMLMKTKPMSGNIGVFGLVFVFMVNAVICIVLWLLSSRISGVIVQDERNIDSVDIVLDYNSLLLIGIKIVGVILVILSIEEGVYEAISIFGVNLDRFDLVQRMTILLNLMFPFLKVIIGYMLIVNNKLHALIRGQEI